MTSVRCPDCGLLNWTTAESCKRCGALFIEPDQAFQDEPEQPQVHSHAYTQSHAAPAQVAQGQTAQGYAATSYQPTGYTAPAYAPQQSRPYGFYAQPPMHKSSGLAIASMVLGILALISFGLLGMLALVGLILGIVALKKAKSHPMHFGGEGFAVAGIVTSCLAMIAFVGVVAAIAIPNLLASRRAANEGSAIGSLRTLSSAQATYQATEGNGNFGTIEQLMSAGLIDQQLGSGKKNGYKFVIRVKPYVSGNAARGYMQPAEYEVVATPLKYGTNGTGKRSFFVDQTGVVRGADKDGMEATVEDPPFDAERYSRSVRMRDGNTGRSIESAP
ncbi:MAG TPA: DUF4190 domain-containing protein [Pyrinomonadaceae bacterium]|jgi:type II secretory pathway pseudopilin PulG